MYRKLAHKAALSLTTLAMATGLALADTIAEIDALGDVAATNNSITNPQALTTSNGEVIVPAWLGPPSGEPFADIDYYSFQAETGNKITAAINNGVGGIQSVKTTIGLFGPKAGGGWERLRHVAGDGITDPRIDEYEVVTTGTYVVGIVNGPRSFYIDGRVLNATTTGTGDYTLTITGLPVTAKPVKQVDLKAKTWPGMVGKLNPKNRGNVWAALLSSDNFDPMQVDKDSLTFGVTGDEDSLRSCRRKARDLNGDNKPDLICRFVLAETGISPDKLEVMMKGKTLDGEEFEGSAAVALPSKHAKKKGHSHDDDDDDDDAYEDHRRGHKHDHTARRR